MPRPRKLKDKQISWAPRMEPKEKKKLAKQRKPNGTRKFSQYTLPKQFRAAPHTSGFAVEPKPGRPPYQPTDGDRAFVTKLVGYGMTVEQICSLIESRYGECIKPDTLRKYFRMELEVGNELLVEWVGDLLVTHAKNGDVGAAIFLAKTRGKRQFSSQIQIADPNGNPIAAPNVVVMFGAEDENDDGDMGGKLLPAQGTVEQ